MSVINPIKNEGDKNPAQEMLRNIYPGIGMVPSAYNDDEMDDKKDNTQLNRRTPD